MNFQAVEAAQGNRVTMYGTFVEIGGAEYTAQNKPKAVCKVRDMTGVAHNVHIYQGKGFLPGPQNLNQRYEFSLSTFQGTYQGNRYTGYSGFWKANGQQGPQQQAPQAPSQQPQSNKPDWDAISRGKVRHGVVCAYIQSGREPDIAELEYWANYIMTGQAPRNIPDPSIQQPDDDIPF